MKRCQNNRPNVELSGVNIVGIYQDTMCMFVSLYDTFHEERDMCVQL